MRERIWDNIARGLLLQSVIAYRGGGLQCRFNIARLDEPPFFFRVESPNTSKTVGL